MRGLEELASLLSTDEDEEELEEINLTSRKRSNESSSDTVQKKKQKVVEHKATAFKSSLLKIFFNKDLKDVNKIGVFILDLLELRNIIIKEYVMDEPGVFYLNMSSDILESTNTPSSNIIIRLGHTRSPAHYFLLIENKGRPLRNNEFRSPSESRGTERADAAYFKGSVKVYEGGDSYIEYNILDLGMYPWGRLRDEPQGRTLVNTTLRRMCALLKIDSTSGIINACAVTHIIAGLLETKALDAEQLFELLGT